MQSVTMDKARANARPRSGPPGAALLAAVLITVVAILSLNVDYLALSPGPSRDVLALIKLDGAKADETNGQLLLTTVSLRQPPITVAEAIRGWFDDSFEVFPAAALIPEGETVEDADRRAAQQMLDSKQAAAAAALTHLGFEVSTKPAGARIEHLVSGAPAESKLRRGDVIVSASGATINRVDDLTKQIAKVGVGGTVDLKVRRASETISVKISTAADESDPPKPMIGVIVADVVEAELPVAIDIDSLGIGGPSAGLMYALGIVDLLDRKDLVKGRTIAGTGEISFAGVVSPVGGVRHKVESVRGGRGEADIFLVPRAELDEACAFAAEGLQVIGVDELTDAVKALTDDAFAKKRSCR